MNSLAIALMQMRQRALGTALTVAAVALGTALAIAIMILRREGGALFGQREYGCDLIVGAKGSPLQLTLNTLYHLDRSPGNIPYSVYETLARDPQYRPMVQAAVPYAVGDSFAGQRIVATTPALFGLDGQGATLRDEAVLEYRPGKRFSLAAGRCFKPARFEAVIGSDIPERAGLRLGDRFKATHGLPDPGAAPDIHEQEWTVVGVLAPTGTANDRVLFITLESFYAISEHDEGLRAQAALKRGGDPPPRQDAPAYTIAADGAIVLKLPKEQWQVSAVLVRARSEFWADSLMYQINNAGQAQAASEAQAVNPAATMSGFFATFLAPAAALLQLVSYLVTVVAAVGILVGIYNAIAARAKDIAIMRALGATRLRILAIVGGEALLVGAAGALIGLVLAHAGIAVASPFARRYLGESLDWSGLFTAEWLYVLAVVGLAGVAGLVPALKAYRTPVAANLVG